MEGLFGRVGVPQRNRERDGPGCLFGEETGSRDLSGEKQKVLGGPGREHGPGVGVKMAIEKVLVRGANVGFGGRGGRDRKEPGILVWSGLWVVRVKVGREMTYYYIRGGGSMRGPTPLPHLPSVLPVPARDRARHRTRNHMVTAVSEGRQVVS